MGLREKRTSLKRLETMEDHSEWLKKIESLRAEGSLEKTLAYLDGVLALFPDDPQVYYQIAWTHDEAPIVL